MVRLVLNSLVSRHGAAVWLPKGFAKASALDALQLLLGLHPTSPDRNLGSTRRCTRRWTSLKTLPPPEYSRTMKCVNSSCYPASSYALVANELVTVLAFKWFAGVFGSWSYGPVLRSNGLHKTGNEPIQNFSGRLH